MKKTIQQTLQETKEITQLDDKLTAITYSDKDKVSDSSISSKSLIEMIQKTHSDDLEVIVMVRDGDSVAASSSPNLKPETVAGMVVLMQQFFKDIFQQEQQKPKATVN